jgi:hypothetical protein
MLFAIRGKRRASSFGRAAYGSVAIHATVASSSTGFVSVLRRTFTLGVASRLRAPLQRLSARRRRIPSRIPATSSAAPVDAATATSSSGKRR